MFPFVSLVVCYCWFIMICRNINALHEEDRIREYHARGHEWPPNEYNPNTPGWRKIMQRRLRQLNNVPSLKERYNGYIGVVHSALTCKNFTENGWGVTRAPQVCAM